MYDYYYNNDNDDNGNKFGEGIPYRKGKAIQLIKYENGKIILNKESLEIIKNIEEPVAIISVVGSYRRGKSYFANVLHGRHDGFELGSKVDSCTKGIFMWDTPFIHNNCRVIILDCEGIDDPKQDEVWATKLFILCLAISSTFIYNINGIVGKDDIGKLYTMTDLSKFLVNSEDEEKDYLPRLVVLLRDFGLIEPDDFREYFLEKLTQVNSDAAAGITNHFKDLDVYALPHPGCKKKVLHELEKIETSQLDTEFISKMTHAVSEIYDTITAKKINFKSMTGISFSKFLEDCVKHMNSNTNNLDKLSLPTQYTSLINFMSKLAIDIGFTYYSTMMTIRSIDDFPINWEDFENEHSMILSQADFLFNEKLIGSYHQTLDIRKEFDNLIEDEKNKFIEKNSESVKNYNLNLANSLWQVHVSPGLTADSLFEDYNEFNNALDSFMQEYTNKSFNGPEAMDIYKQYKDDKTESALETLDKMFKLRDATKAVKDAHQELIDQINQSQERLNLLLSEKYQEEFEYNEQIEELISKIDELTLQLSN
ncbi:guanylate-binding protein [Rhizophagus diaphanus]|nr:guanylate-binding protein [Rhizophagus diaphanus] [Rhizophagus sp. MUCL 43196]